jgi:hypothetical protein
VRYQLSGRRQILASSTTLEPHERKPSWKGKCLCRV